MKVVRQVSILVGVLGRRELYEHVGGNYSPITWHPCYARDRLEETRAPFSNSKIIRLLRFTGTHAVHILGPKFISVHVYFPYLPLHNRTNTNYILISLTFEHKISILNLQPREYFNAFHVKLN